MLIEYLLLAAASVSIINGIMEWRVLTKENASLTQKILGLTLPLWLPLALLLLAWYLESCGISAHSNAPLRWSVSFTGTAGESARNAIEFRRES